MKTCCMCREDLPEDKFKTNKRRKDGLQSQCIECHKAYRRRHYLANRQTYINKAAAWREEFKRWWNDFKSKLSCSRCDENHPATLDFHHTSDNKEANVAQLVADGNRERLLKEIKKCIVLCSNCHRKEHYNMRQ